jgi:GntR family transcriptional regulator
MANPMYRQIAENLRERIEAGQIEQGRQLPTELELREQFGASRNTVRDAIKWLTTLGLVETKPGQGTFVVRKINPFVTTLTANPDNPGGDKVVGPGGGTYGEVDKSGGYGQKRKLDTSDPQVEIQKASGPIATLLQLAEGTQIISRHQKRTIDGTVWSMQTSYYPRGLAAQGADRLLEVDNIPEGTVRYLFESVGLRQVGYRDWITVRTPNSTEAFFFNLPADGRVGVFEIFETAFDQTGTPMRLTVTIYPTDRNQFHIDVGRVPDLPPPIEIT